MLWYFITESIVLCATLFYRFSARAMLVGNLISNWPANLMSTSILSFPTSHVRWWSWRYIIESNISFGKALRMFDHYRVFTEQAVSRSMAWTLFWEPRNLSLLTQSHNCSDSTPPTTSWHLLSLLRFLCGIMLWCDAVQAVSAFSGGRVDQAIYFLYFFWFNMFWIQLHI